MKIKRQRFGFSRTSVNSLANSNSVGESTTQVGVGPSFPAQTLMFGWVEKPGLFFQTPTLVLVPASFCRSSPLSLVADVQIPRAGRLFPAITFGGGGERSLIEASGVRFVPGAIAIAPQTGAELAQTNALSGCSVASCCQFVALCIAGRT